MTANSDDLWRALHLLQERRKALFERRLALSEQVANGLVGSEEKAAWYAERESVDKAIDNVKHEIQGLLELIQLPGERN